MPENNPNSCPFTSTLNPLSQMLATYFCNLERCVEVAWSEISIFFLHALQAKMVLWINHSPMYSDCRVSDALFISFFFSPKCCQCISAIKTIISFFCVYISLKTRKL